MRPTHRWSIALCSGLVILTACDNSVAPVETISVDGPAAALVPAPSSLVAFYSFDHGAGDGTVSPGATHRSADGYEGGAFHFDGTGAYIDLPVDVNPSSRPAVTMGAWFKAESLPADGRPVQVLSHDNGGFDRSIGLDMRASDGGVPDGRYHVSTFTGAGVLPGPLADTARWTFVAAVYDETSVTLYVDGQAYSQPAGSGEGFDFLRVGGNPGGFNGGEPMTGLIDNVFIYDRALSATEIDAIRAGGACVLAGTPCGGRPMVTVSAPSVAAEGSPVVLSFSAQDPDGDALSLTWDLGDGTVGIGAPPASHVYADNGTYTVQLTARDASGLAATARMTVQVHNVRPILAGFDGTLLVVGDTYTSTVPFTDPGVDVWIATVDYGDGSPAETMNLAGGSVPLEHKYTMLGTYRVRVSVRDDDDITPVTATATVTVVDFPAAFAEINEFISMAVTRGEITPQRAHQVTTYLTGAASSLIRADHARTWQQELAMVQNADRLLLQAVKALQAISNGGMACWAAHLEINALRALLGRRLVALRARR